MRVLVTGSSGFIGSYMIKKLLRDRPDWDIVGIERLSVSGNQERLRKLDLAKYSSVLHDLRNPVSDYLAETTLGKNFDYIIHIAASSHVDRSIEDPMSFVLDNVVATCNILEFARRCPNLKKFVYFSTDEVFGPAPPGVIYLENDRYNSTNPYSATKAGGEELAVAYRNTYKLPVVVTHTMNVFGENQHPEKFIPKCIEYSRTGKTLQIHSDSTKTIPGSRFYVHGDDVADAVMFVLALDDSAEEMCPKYNIVGPEELNNYELAQMIAGIVGNPLVYEFVDFHSSRPGHDLRYAISGQKLKELGWAPKFTVKQRLEEVISASLEDAKQ